MDSAPSTPGSSHENGGAKLYKTNKELLAYMSQAFNVNRGDDFEERGSDDSSLDLDDDDDLSVGSSSSFSVSSYATSVQDTKTMGDETRMLTEEGGLVKRSKVAIFMGIVALACTSALVTTYFVRKNETTTYHEKFASFSEDVSEKSQKALRQAFTATQQLSRTITDAIVSADNYFVAVPLFEIYGGEAKEAAQAEVIFWTPRIAEARLSDWELFATENQQWILDGLVYENSTVDDPGSIPTKVYTRNGAHVHHAKDDIHIHGYHFPVWQMVGAPRNASIVNLDLMADSSRMEHDMVDATLLRQPLLSSIQDLQYLTMSAHDTPVNTSQEEWLEENNITIGLDKYYPQMYLEQLQQSYILQPIFASRDGYFFSNAGVAADARSQTLESDVVGFAVAVISWKSLFSDILPSGVSGMVVVVSDGCGTTLSYQINGKTVEYLGIGDMHDPMFEEEVVNITDFGSLADFSVVTHLHREINGTSYDERHAGTKKGHCQFTVQVYPSEEFVDIYNSDTQTLYIAVIVVIFVVVIFLLCVYDLMVIARQRKIIHIAKQTNTLISSLFPKAVQKRILEDARKTEKLKLLSADEYDQVLGDDSKAKSVMEEHMKGQYQTKAIADYFPSATIFFADIVGFTAWSSTRDPTQVFELLETLFHSFDQLARKRRVFKVETVGDCYVAATGLPEARKDHPVVMARFARDILYKFGVLVKQLEEKLGPDTGDLGLRVGLHSGPVTAGVLRGEKSRFQLFGDTVNTAARMESNGAPNRIHLSKETADLLMQAGKVKWVKPREELIHAKGKGELQTYWLEYSRSESRKGSVNSVTDSIRNSLQSEYDESKKILSEISFNPMSEKLQRLVKWNTELLSKSLQLILGRRVGAQIQVDDDDKMRSLEMASRTVARQGKLVFDEVVEIINLPPKAEINDSDPLQLGVESIDLSPEVYSQLHDYVRTIAAMYPEDNPFHNFEHASHVCMSTIKLLARIVAPNDDNGAGNLHDNTYGITSDPLTQFAAVFSALIHDVDHPGVPNMTLVTECTSLAASYQNKSVAEQNSIDLAWDLLMDPAYEDLRRALYVNETEFNRFRTLVVNLVMATDIMDKQMGAFRKARWNKVFGDDDEKDIRGSISQKDINRKATIVLEHLIQASDVSHTMQHWHIFVKWNERLFQEMSLAYDEGRAEKNPAENWYQGEIGFFDFYIIPLAKKLESCGVFGVSSDEYLQYAQNNRNEWERKGHEQVQIYIENYRMKRETMTMATPPSLVPQEEEEEEEEEEES